MEPTDLARRIASRVLRGDVIADPKEQLHRFQTLVDLYTKREEFARAELVRLKEVIRLISSEPEKARPLVQELKHTSNERRAIWYELRESPSFKAIQPTASALFWAILQQYVLPSQIQRGIEAASRLWSKKKITIRPKHQFGTYDMDAEYLEAYLKMCLEMRTQVSSAQAAIVKGKLNSDPEVAATVRFPAGSFVVVNTGGFNDKVMKSAVDLAHKAEQAMRGIGLARVCYGDILISKTINNRRNVAAFYLHKNDEMFVRANIPDDWNTVRVICHELTHRLVNKFLQGKTAEIRAIYRTLKTQDFITSERIPDELLPKVDETLVERGMTLVVVDVDKYNGKVKMRAEGEPNARFSLPIEAWLQRKGIEPHLRPDFRGFITHYASTDQEENFCEMVSFYAIGKLPKSQVELLLPVLQ
jgi:hypothetical protein